MVRISPGEMPRMACSTRKVTVVEAGDCREDTGTRPIEVTRPEKMIPAVFTIRSKATVPGTTGDTTGNRPGKFADFEICSGLTGGPSIPNFGAKTGTRSSTLSCPRSKAGAININDNAASRRQQFTAQSITW